ARNQALVDGIAMVAETLSRQADALANLQEGESQLVRLQESLHQNLTALTGAGTFEQAVQSLTAATHLLTTRVVPAPAQNRTAAATQDVAKEQAAVGDLQNRLLKEKTQLDQAGATLARLRTSLEKTNRSAGVSNSELEKWSRDLVQLERTLTDLRRIKRHEG